MRCAVLGKPIGHSLSPVLHRAAYAALGLDWTYSAIEVDEASLPRFLDGLGEDWRGLSLTMPLKRTVLPLLDEVEESVQLSGAANTVVIEGGRLQGSNTDIGGARAALIERGVGAVERVVVLGGGATAASVLLAAADLGAREAVLAVRDPARAGRTVAIVQGHRAAPSVEVVTLDEGLPSADLVVSTVPADAQSPALVARIDAEVGPAAVFEVVYDPWPTPLAAHAQASGRTLVSGLDLLVHQAVLQVAAMTGRPGPLDQMRAAGEQALAHRVTQRVTQRVVPRAGR